MTDTNYRETYPADMGKLRAWFHLSRLPFHTVGILPFVLGNLLVWRTIGSLNLAVMGWGILAVAFTLFATHYSGEYFDYEVDKLSTKLRRNRFTGGSQVLQAGTIPRRHALVAAFISLILAGAVGVLLQFYYNTGILTIPLGVIGMLGGLLYVMKPIRWAYRGFGETCIGFYYGWLTIATSYYIQTGQFPYLVHWTALPIAFSIFNVILVNEFPDYLADREAGKRNLVVRFGKKRMSRIYVLMSVAIWLSFILSIRAGIPSMSLLFFFPIFLLSVATTLQVFRKGYEDEKKLEKICASTLIVNLGTTVSLILGVWLS
jgi:1,4-dihydroxy-2-naphthoate octaprenyltransferase